MSNVSSPSGPVNPNNQPRSTEPAKPGTDKFKDLMKIDRSDEKQKKKKKRSEEAAEEEKAKMQAGQTSGEKNAEAAKKAQKYARVEKVKEGEHKQPFQSKRPEESPDVEEQDAIAAASSQKKPYEPIESIKSEEEIKSETKEAAASAELRKDLDQIFEEEQQTLEKEAIGEDFKQATTRAEKTKKDETASVSTPPPSSALGPTFLAPSTEVPPAYALLNAETFALFEKMVSAIMILQNTGISETTIHLNTHEFMNTPFAGAQIIIREYSTAPLAYNIELVGNPLAAEYFRKNIPLLRTAFDEGRHRFRINRLESSIERVERKEGPSEEES